MKRLFWVVGAAAAAAALVGLLPGERVSSADRSDVHLVSRGPLEVWSVYEGRLEARHVTVLMSRLPGAATVVELAAEGSQASPGDVLARFDDAQIRMEILRLRREHAQAQAELEGLQQAAHPLKLQELEMAVAESRSALQAEEAFLADSAELVAENLISEQERAQQAALVRQLRERHRFTRRELELTRDYLQPAALARARANFESAAEALRLAEEQLAQCIVRSPAAGAVAYVPTHIGAEYRTVRVGDAVHRNQPFMSIPDMSDVVVRFLVPEAELAKVRVGAEAGVAPVAYPSIRLAGRIETVGSIAQQAPGQSAWRNSFRVVAALESGDHRLRSGMSVYVQVLSYRNPDAVRIPRTLVAWRDEDPYCVVLRDGREERRPVTLGPADTRHIEVVAGLSPGDRLVRP